MWLGGWRAGRSGAGEAHDAGASRVTRPAAQARLAAGLWDPRNHPNEASGGAQGPLRRRCRPVSARQVAGGTGEKEPGRATLHGPDASGPGIRDALRCVHRHTITRYNIHTSTCVHNRRSLCGRVDTVTARTAARRWAGRAEVWHRPERCLEGDLRNGGPPLHGPGRPHAAACAIRRPRNPSRSNLRR